MNKATVLAKFKPLNYDKIYHYLAIAFAFTMPFSRAMVSFFIIIFPLIWMIEGDFKRKFSEIKNSKFLLIFMIFYALVLISALFFSDDTKLAMKWSRLYLYWLTIFVLATSLKQEWIRNIITAFLFGMVVSEIIAYGVFFDLWEFKHATKQNPSPFMMHIDYSIFLSFTSILLFTRLLSKNYALKDKIFMGVFFLSTTGNLFLQTGRTGQYAYIIAIIAMFFLHYGFKFKTIFGSLLTLAAIYFSAYNLSDSFKMRLHRSIQEIQTISSGNLNTSFGTRMTYWIVTYEIAKENPVFGVGLGDYLIAAKKALTKDKFDNYAPFLKNFMSYSHFHNQFLQTTVQMGVIGLSFCLMFYFLAFKMAILTKNKEFRDIFTLFMIIYTLGSCTEPVWGKQFTIIIWVFMLSLMIVNTKYEQIQKRDENSAKF